METNQSACCKACNNVLHGPVMLPCLHHTCVDCLCLSLQQTGRIKCPECDVVHPLTTTSIAAPSPLLLHLLADQLAMCSICKGAVQLKYYDEHVKSSCSEYLHVTVQQILNKPLSCPLSKLEEKIGSNVVRRWFHNSDNNVIAVPTGGPVCNMNWYFTSVA